MLNKKLLVSVVILVGFLISVLAPSAWSMEKEKELTPTIKKDDFVQVATETVLKKRKYIPNAYKELQLQELQIPHKQSLGISQETQDEMLSLGNTDHLIDQLKLMRDYVENKVLWKTQLECNLSWERLEN